MIEYMTPEELERAKKELAEYDHKLEKKERFKNKYIRPITDGIKFIIFKPLSIIFSIISMISKFLGGVGCVGAVYGLTRWYKIYKEHLLGVAIKDCADYKLALNLTIFPFIAFAVYVISAGISEYLDDRLPFM